LSKAVAILAASSANFAIDTDVVKTELLIKAEDLDTTILNNKEIIKNMSNVMLENSRILEDYNKKLRECIETGVIYCSAQEASTQTGIGRTTISDHCLNKTKNQKWKFTE
jgi:hypothetical protein